MSPVILICPQMGTVETTCMKAHAASPGKYCMVHQYELLYTREVVRYTQFLVPISATMVVLVLL
jgi:hypothetical protein